MHDIYIYIYIKNGDYIYALHICIEHFYIWNGYLELDIYIYIYSWSIADTG